MWPRGPQLAGNMGMVENQMEKNMEHDMEPRIIRFIGGILGLYKVVFIHVQCSNQHPILRTLNLKPPTQPSTHWHLRDSGQVDP